jgi:altered-inheritance-of-mitochondria protein 13
VQKEIEHALEKENLDRERSMAGLDDEGDGSGSVKSSAVLLGDLEEIRGKVDRYQQRREPNDLPSLKASGEAVISCYKYVTFCYLLCAFITTSRNNPSKVLECWQEVSKFKAFVALAEQVKPRKS